MGHVEGVKDNNNGKNCRVKTRPVLCAFTLSETLIALVIIGIVAAITVPVIMGNYTKKTIETRLQKFYTTMNNAIRRAEVDFGDKRDWYAEYNNMTNEEWFNKYLKPYLSIMKTEYASGQYVIYLNDGSSFYHSESVKTVWHYFPGSFSKCPKIAASYGVCQFLFMYDPTTSNKYINKGFEPYKAGWNGTKAGLYSEGQYNCKDNGQRCTAIIQENGWKIPDDYPRRIRL